MTQVYFITRGKDNAIQEWLKHLSGKWFPYEYNGQKGLLEGMLRPIQLWEYAFPEEYRDIALSTIFGGDTNIGLHQSDWKGQAGLMALRKALGAQKIKKWDTTKGMLPMPRRDGMSVMGIGERKDKINYHPETGKPNEGI